MLKANGPASAGRAYPLPGAYSVVRRPRPADAHGALEDVEPPGVGLHQPVLDPVVDHLDVVAAAGRAGVQVALLGGAAELLAAGGARDVAAAGGQRLEDRVEPLHRLLGPA